MLPKDMVSHQQAWYHTSKPGITPVDSIRYQQALYYTSRPGITQVGLVSHLYTWYPTYGHGIPAIDLVSHVGLQAWYDPNRHDHTHLWLVSRQCARYHLNIYGILAVVNMSTLVGVIIKSLGKNYFSAPFTQPIFCGLCHFYNLSLCHLTFSIFDLKSTNNEHCL